MMQSDGECWETSAQHAASNRLLENTWNICTENEYQASNNVAWGYVSGMNLIFYSVN